MEEDVSVTMVWSMAAMEARALGWTEIEPAHLLCAALKFAELNAEELKRLGETPGDIDELLQRHRDLRMRLDDRWGIAIPDISTPLRRTLRRRGNNEPKLQRGGIVRRSDAAREVFRAARRTAERDGRKRFFLADLVDVILHDPDQWVRRGLDQHGILSASQLVQHEQATKKWEDVFVPLQPSGSPSGAEKNVS